MQLQQHVQCRQVDNNPRLRASLFKEPPSSSNGLAILRSASVSDIQNCPDSTAGFRSIPSWCTDGPEQKLPGCTTMGDFSWKYALLPFELSSRMEASMRHLMCQDAQTLHGLVNIFSRHHFLSTSSHSACSIFIYVVHTMTRVKHFLIYDDFGNRIDYLYSARGFAWWPLSFQLQQDYITRQKEDYEDMETISRGIHGELACGLHGIWRPCCTVPDGKQNHHGPSALQELC